LLKSNKEVAVGVLLLGFKEGAVTVHLCGFYTAKLIHKRGRFSQDNF
jgi:hypothetical protein